LSFFLTGGPQFLFKTALYIAKTTSAAYITFIII